MERCVKALYNDVYIDGRKDGVETDSDVMRSPIQASTGFYVTAMYLN